MHIRDNKFIVSASARSGSSFLIRLLTSHPEVVCHGELFQTGRKQGFLAGHYERLREQSPEADRAITELRERDVNRYLYDIVFDSQNKSAAGFKFKTTEQFNPDFRDITDLLVADTDIKVILLRRRDLLAQYISQKCVSLTGINRALQENEIPQYDPFDVPASSVLSYFKRLTDWEKKAAQAFAEHRTFHIDYEDLVTNAENCRGKLQDFIGVETGNMETDLKKLVKDSYALVANIEPTIRILTENGYSERLSIPPSN